MLLPPVTCLAAPPRHTSPHRGLLNSLNTLIRLMAACVGRRPSGSEGRGKGIRGRRVFPSESCTVMVLVAWGRMTEPRAGLLQLDTSDAS